MARYDLNEAEWRIVEPLLPAVGKDKRRVASCRVVNGIFYVLRTGSPWRDLPERYGALYDGLPPLQSLGQEGAYARRVRSSGGPVAAVSSPDRFVDRAGPPAAAGGKRGPDHAISRSCGGLSTKIHAVVDQDGLPVRSLITPGQALDKTAVPDLLAGLQPA